MFSSFLPFESFIRWTELPNLIEGRFNAVAVWTPDGRIYTIGGSRKNNTETVFLNSVEVLSRPSGDSGTINGPWRNVAPLPNHNGLPSAIFCTDVILVFVTSVREIQSYAPSPLDEATGMGQWTSIQSTGMPQLNQGVFLSSSSESIYALGECTEMSF